MLQISPSGFQMQILIPKKEAFVYIIVWLHKQADSLILTDFWVAKSTEVSILWQHKNLEMI